MKIGSQEYYQAKFINHIRLRIILSVAFLLYNISWISYKVDKKLFFSYQSMMQVILKI